VERALVGVAQLEVGALLVGVVKVVCFLQ
jgi:hypothetical protein